MKILPKRAFCMNLDSRTDRWEQVTKDFVKLQQVMDIKLERVSAVPVPSRPQHGVAQTVHKIINIAKQERLEYVLILEDDLYIIDAQKIVNCLNNVPDDWDILSGGVYHYVPAEQVAHDLDNIHSAKWVQMRDFCSLHFIILRDTVYSHALNLDGKQHVDRALGQLVRNGKLKMYLMYPMPCQQRPGFSNIRKREVNDNRRQLPWMDTAETLKDTLIKKDIINVSNSQQVENTFDLIKNTPLVSNSQKATNDNINMIKNTPLVSNSQKTTNDKINMIKNTPLASNLQKAIEIKKTPLVNAANVQKATDDKIKHKPLINVPNIQHTINDISTIKKKIMLEMQPNVTQPLLRTRIQQTILNQATKLVKEPNLDLENNTQNILDKIAIKRAQAIESKKTIKEPAVKEKIHNDTTKIIKEQRETTKATANTVATDGMAKIIAERKAILAKQNQQARIRAVKTAPQPVRHRKQEKPMVQQQNLIQKANNVAVQEPLQPKRTRAQRTPAQPVSVAVQEPPRPVRTRAQAQRTPSQPISVETQEPPQPVRTRAQTAINVPAQEPPRPVRTRAQAAISVPVQEPPRPPRQRTKQATSESISVYTNNSEPLSTSITKLGSKLEPNTKSSVKNRFDIRAERNAIAAANFK